MEQRDSRELAALAVALGATKLPPLSRRETALVKTASRVNLPESGVLQVKIAMQQGEDPLGDWFIALRSAEDRRPLGQTYTPSPIIDSMIGWVADAVTEPPVRIVDAGAGSGRFAVACAKRFPSAQIVAVEVDPLAALMCRSNLVTAGAAGRSRVELKDYHSLALEPVNGPTLYIGNPPYVRHHNIEPKWKQWLTETATSRGLSSSQLAGLHVHFFLATAQMARPGDLGVFVTSAEWLDVNYGCLVRELLLDGLCGEAIHLVEPTAMPFEGTATTAAITCFTVGAGLKSMRMKQHKTVKDLGHLQGGKRVSKQRLADATRWTPLLRATPKLPEGYVELGEICRVHRGAVTGANRVWITSASNELLPRQVLLPSITRAHELFQAGEALTTASHLRRVIDIPEDLDVLDAVGRRQVESFLRKAKRAGAADGYVAQNRRSWWSVGLRTPAPILATYMARRPPAFVMNTVAARHINIAHGLYPRIKVTPLMLERLSDALRGSVRQAQGRTYAGGLTKFEPKEMERLPVPGPDLLMA